MAASIWSSSSSSLSLLINKSSPKFNNQKKVYDSDKNRKQEYHYSGFSNNISFSTSKHHHHFSILACLPSSPQQQPQNKIPSTNKLYVSGLSFRTTEESLRNAFQSFGQLIEVNLVMDKIANRPRGFAFLRYATKEESDKAIEGMHGKFLDGRVIFVEFAKPRSQLNHGVKQDSKPYR